GAGRRSWQDNLTSGYPGQEMLALGTGAVGVMAASAPGIVLAGVAVFWLMHRQQRAAMV
ncbi:hypothetical protein ACQR8J_29165, partial [Klebsiella pneumoniae]